MALAFLGLRRTEMAGLQWVTSSPGWIDIKRGRWGKHVTKGKTGPRSCRLLGHSCLTSC
jgi:hypothetical protein